jgi:hypothetical protein
VNGGAVRRMRTRLSLSTGRVIYATQICCHSMSAASRFAWSVFLRRITPTKTIANDMDDPGNNTLVVNTRNAVGQRKIGLNALQLRTGKPEKIAHGMLLINGKHHYQKKILKQKLIGPEPSDQGNENEYIKQAWQMIVCNP